MPKPAFWLGFLVAVAGITGIAMLAFGGGSKPAPQPESAQPIAASVGDRASESIVAFSRTRSAADALTPAAANEIASLSRDAASIDPMLRPGQPDPTESRRLLTDLGSHRVSLFAVPTAKGQVCLVFSEFYGTPGCFDRFTEKAPISWDLRDIDESGSGEPAVVDGIVPPTVSGVDVVVNGETHQARLSQNAFFYQLTTASSRPSAIIVKYQNFPPRTIDLGGQPIPVH